jgi:hypothetical protein
VLQLELAHMDRAQEKKYSIFFSDHLGGNEALQVGCAALSLS